MPGALASALHGGQQEGHEHADDRDDDEQFDERECHTATSGNGHGDVSVISVRECAVRSRAKVIIADRSKKCQRSTITRVKRRELLRCQAITPTTAIANSKTQSIVRATRLCHAGPLVMNFGSGAAVAASDRISKAALSVLNSE